MELYRRHNEARPRYRRDPQAERLATFAQDILVLAAELGRDSLICAAFDAEDRNWRTPAAILRRVAKEMEEE